MYRVLAMVGVVAAFALVALGGGSAAAGDKDCSDFPNQKKAQKFFKKHNPKKDPHYLDADNDGIACEDNPCPCAGKVMLGDEVVGRITGVS